MFSSLNEKEKEAFKTQNYDSFIPGYTGHCPTLKFQYGRCYGSKTKEILKEIRNKKLQDVQKGSYREQDYKSNILQPIARTKSQFCDFALDYKYRAPRYITGYTGFVPTLNFRYGKSYGKALNDSICDGENKQRRIQLAEDEIKKMYCTNMSGKVNSIRCKDDVKRCLNEYIDRNKFKEKEVSAENPPISGYTGHIPGVKGNEEFLSQNYHTVVKRGLKLLQEDRQRFNSMKKVQNEVTSVLSDFENTCPKS